MAQAAEAVTPTYLSMSLYKSPVEEFHHRWQVISLFLDALILEKLPEAMQKKQLHDSQTRENLAKLVRLLYAEEEALDLQLHKDANELSMIEQRPCLEYMLEHNIIQNLCSKATKDNPSGLMVLVIVFLTDLLRDSKINHPILPTRNVHRSVCELIQAAMIKEVEDEMIQRCMLHCLHALWVKLKGDPVQTEFFFTRIYHTNTLTSVDSSHSSHSMLLQPPPLSPTKIQELVLFTGLLPHMYRDGKLGQKCREALAIAAGLRETNLIRFILDMTPFCNYAVTGVISAFDELELNAIQSDLEILATRVRFCCALTMVRSIVCSMNRRLNDAKDD